jgi:hypothetical protein
MGFLGDVALKSAIRVSQFNTALPGAGSAFFTAIAPNNPISYFHIYVAIAAAGVLSVKRTVGVTSVSETLSGGGTLTANAGYLFTVPAVTGESITLTYSVTSSTILKLLITEQTGVV